jgi:SagB-type dehydrogenase family enzyme
MIYEHSATDFKVLVDATTANSVRTLNTQLFATGLRTSQADYEHLRSLPGSRVAEEFLLHSRLRRGDAQTGLSVLNYFSEEAQAMLRLLDRGEAHGQECIPLPKSAPLDMSLEAVILRRRSVRDFDGSPLSFDALAAIIRAACGRTGTSALGNAREGIVQRSSPSGGALYPIALHVCAIGIDGLARGLYIFDVHRDSLWRTDGGAAVDAVLGSFAFPGQVISETEAAALCLLVARPWRSMRKYGHRGMRYVFLEAGAMAEHLALAATALGVGSVHCASFYDDEAHEALDIDGVYEALVHGMFLGNVNRTA